MNRTLNADSLVRGCLPNLVPYPKVDGWSAPPLARGVRGELPQAGGCLVFADILHDRRRFPPVRCRAGGLTQVPIHCTEMVQGPAFPVPVAGLPKDRKSLLVAVDGLLEPPQFPVGSAEVGQGRALPVRG